MQLNTEDEQKQEAPSKELIDKLLSIIKEWREKYPDVKMNSNIEYNDDDGNQVNIIHKYNQGNRRVRFTV